MIKIEHGLFALHNAKLQVESLEKQQKQPHLCGKKNSGKSAVKEKCAFEE